MARRRVALVRTMSVRTEVLDPSVLIEVLDPTVTPE
jgi:hypothetical protein